LGNVADVAASEQGGRENRKNQEGPKPIHHASTKRANGG